jgi:hypothetical protein
VNLIYASAIPLAHVGLTSLLPTIMRTTRPYSTLWRQLTKPAGGVYDTATVCFSGAVIAISLLDRDAKECLFHLLHVEHLLLVPAALLAGVGFYVSTVVVTNRTVRTFTLTRQSRPAGAYGWCVIVAAAEEVIWRVLPLIVLATGDYSQWQVAAMVGLSILGFVLLHNPLTRDSRERVLVWMSMTAFATITFTFAAASAITACIVFHVAYNLTQLTTSLRGQGAANPTRPS